MQTQSLPPSVDARSDAELIGLILGGSDPPEAAFRVLYDRFKLEVFAVLVPLLHDRALAEDVLQETFFRVYVSLDRFDASRAFRPWIHQIARNAALDALRLRRKDERSGPRPDTGSSEPTLQEVSRREDRELARRALETLPDDLKTILVQRHALDMKLGELAESWQCAERTITTRLREAAGLFAQAIAGLRRSGRREP